MGGLARPLGRQDARRRRDEFLAQVQLSGCSREPAPRRTVDAPRRGDARVHGHGRGSDGTWSAPWTATHDHDEAERPGQPHLLRAAVPRRQLRHGRRCSRALARTSARSQQGKGPDPATMCLGACGGFAAGFADEGDDVNPLEMTRPGSIRAVRPEGADVSGRPRPRAQMMAVKLWLRLSPPAASAGSWGPERQAPAPSGRLARLTASPTSAESGRSPTRLTGTCRRTRRVPEW